MDQTIEKLPLEQRVAEFKKELETVLVKYNLEIIIVQDFPRYKIVPAEGSLALKVLQNLGFVVSLGYQDKVKKEENDNKV